MTSSQLCWKGPGVLSSTNTRSCLHIMGCTNASCCILDECEHVLWCGCVVGAGKKKGRGKRHSQTKTKRTFPKTTFSLFPFFHLFFFHSFLLAFHSSTIIPFLSTHTSFSCFTHGRICKESKTPNNTTSNPFHCLFLLFKLSFSLLFLLQMIQC